MLEYSPKARGSVDLFFKFRNDIDIYTEDKVADKEFYKILFSRINEGSLRINDVTPLGSKSVVLSKYNEYRNRPSGRKKIFIVDGDLDLITGSNPPSDDYLYIHKAYCVENYLIDENAIVELAYYNDGEKSRDEIRTLLGFDQWLSGLNSLCNLFIYYAILKVFEGGPEIKHVNAFLMQNAGEVEYDLNKSNTYCEEIKKGCVLKISESYENPDDKLVEIFNSIISKWPNNNDTLLKIVSGKDYLLPLLQFKINGLVGKNSCIPTSKFKLFLVNNCNLNALDDLKSFLVAN